MGDNKVHPFADIVANNENLITENVKDIDGQADVRRGSHFTAISSISDITEPPESEKTSKYDHNRKGSKASCSTDFDNQDLERNDANDGDANDGDAHIRFGDNKVHPFADIVANNENLITDNVKDIDGQADVRRGSHFTAISSISDITEPPESEKTSKYDHNRKGSKAS